MTRPPRITFLNRFYWPEEPATAQLLTDLAEALAARGLPISVITSFPRSHQQMASEELHRGVRIHRVRTPRIGGRTAAAKLMDWLGFSCAALWHILRTLRRGDTLILLTDPPLLVVVATPLVRARGIRVFHWVQDIYPELAMVLGNARGLGWLQNLRNRAWQQADGCIVLGQDMARYLAAQHVPPGQIHVSPNWAPRGLGPAPGEEVAAMKANWGLAGKFIVTYSGNLGRVHDIEPVIELARVLREVPEIVFVFIGDGAQRGHLERLTREAALTNVRFLPAQPRRHLATSLATGDVHLVTLRQGCEALVFPSKFYGILAVGRPVLFIGPANCELAHDIESTCIGRAFERGNIAGMAGVLTDWHNHPDTIAAMARNAVRLAHDSPGLEAATTLWYSLLASPSADDNLAANPNEPVSVT